MKELGISDPYISVLELLSGNPYRLVNLPRTDGNGFVTQAELRGELN